MFIGVLNDRLEGLHYQIRKKDTDTEPKYVEKGDPFLGERLQIHWNELYDTGIDIAFGFSGEYYISQILLDFTRCEQDYGVTYDPKRVTLYTKNKERVLFTYSGETGKSILAKTVALPVEETLGEFVITVDVDYSHVILDGIRVIGADYKGDMLYPIPKKVRMEDKTVPAARFTGIAAPEEYFSAAKLLSEKWQEKTGLPIPCSENGNISIRKDGGIAENGCVLTVSEENVEISASDLRGAVYGGETLIKLLKDGALPLCRVEDAPEMPYRGVHLGLPSEENVPFFRRLIKYLISPMGYNFVIVEVGGGLQYSSHPEVSEGYREGVRRAAAGEIPPFPHGYLADGEPISKDTLRELAEYVRSFGMEFVPELNSLSHVHYLTWSHPEIGERTEDEREYSVLDENLADVPPSRFYTGCYCPSNPKSYALIFDLMDEIVETVEPKYFHIGHDEVYEIGACPICRKKDPAELFADDVNRIYDHLKPKGIRLMMWADMLQPISGYKTPPAIRKIPKDILQLDFIWYFHTDKDIEDDLLGEGLPVLFGNLYSSHFPRYETRSRKKGVLGGEVSTWVSTDEDSIAREGKIYDFLYTANMLWNEILPEARYAYDRVINGLMPELREKLSGRVYPSLHPGHAETKLTREGEYFPVNGKAESILIEHTASTLMRRIPWVELPVVGNYVVRYQDGTEERIPVTYGGNVAYRYRRHNEPFSQPYYRHNGYTGTYYTDGTEEKLPDGRIETWYRLEWTNPQPEKEIASVTYVPGDDTQIETRSISVIQKI